MRACACACARVRVCVCVYVCACARVILFLMSLVLMSTSQRNAATPLERVYFSIYIIKYILYLNKYIEKEIYAVTLRTFGHQRDNCLHECFIFYTVKVSSMEKNLTATFFWRHFFEFFFAAS